MRVFKGKFFMGRYEPDPEFFQPERPQHTVKLKYAYYIDRYPATNKQYRLIRDTTGWNPVTKIAMIFSGRKESLPVVRISWHDAQSSVKWLNETVKN